MKFILAFLLLPLLGNAQKTEPLYYDWQWKPCDVSQARFATLIKKIDSGWERSDYYVASSKLQMKGLYSDSACNNKNGFFSYFYSNGRLSSQGKYVNNQKEGIWISYHNNGMMNDSSVYSNGKPVGISLAWHTNGYLADSVNVDENGRAVSVGWFDNGNPAEAGILINNKKNALS